MADYELPDYEDVADYIQYDRPKRITYETLCRKFGFTTEEGKDMFSRLVDAELIRPDGWQNEDE